jgi:hypothetical protein
VDMLFRVAHRQEHILRRRRDEADLRASLSRTRSMAANTSRRTYERRA